MRVLVACEYSGAVRDAFRERGHDAMSCDLLPTEAPGPHYQGDVRDVLGDGWDLMVAHPPCTHLATSGARWFKGKVREQAESLDFVRQLAAAPIPRIAIENPVGVIGSRLAPPTQIVQPWQFGDSAQKTTCLWLINLPPLNPTKIVDPGEFHEFVSAKGEKKRMPKWYYEALFDRENRWKIRSATFPGIARAMAEQWGALEGVPADLFSEAA